MSATCTWVRARKNLNPIGNRRRGGRGCRYRSPTVQGPDDVLERVRTIESMTIAELQRAFAILGRYVKSGRRDVLVARLRIAVQLENLGA